MKDITNNVCKKTKLNRAVSAVILVIMVITIVLTGCAPKYSVTDVSGDEYGNVFQRVASPDCDSEKDAVKIAKDAQLGNKDTYKEYIRIVGDGGVGYEVFIKYGKIERIKVYD